MYKVDPQTLEFNKKYGAKRVKKFRYEWADLCDKFKKSGYDLSKIKITMRIKE